MTNTETALFNLIKSSLFNIPADFPADTDFDEVLKEAKAQTIVALVSDVVPTDYRANWQNAADQSKAAFLRLLYEQTKVVSLLKGAGISFVIIKGTAAAIYYPTPYNRTMGDIDILVSGGGFDKAFELLKENGYEFDHDFCDEREYVFKKGGVLIELHKKYSDNEYDIENFLQDGIARSETVELYGNKFPILPKPENGLLILDHIRHHLFGGLGIRQIIDFMMFVNSEPNEEKFRSEFVPVFEKAGLDTLAKVITKMCKKYFGLPVKASWCESAEDKTCDELLETVYEKGNFGVKDPYQYRPMESFTLTVREYGFFRTLQRAGVSNCKAFQKYKFLRPFAWLYQLFRYSKRGIAAIFKRKKLVNDFSSGRKKFEFYKRLGIK